jgi:O-antigen/teichoic acid export membrane protein
MAIINLAAVSLGNTLNNVRLITDVSYSKKGYIGDFNPIIIISSVIVIFIIPFLYKMFSSLSILSAIVLILFLFLETLFSYYRVVYRLELNFSGALKNSLISAFGTMVGVFLVWLTHLWPLAYLSSIIASVSYLIPKNRLIEEPFRTTPLMKLTLEKWGVLILTSLFANALVYLDRFLLFPIIGSEAVSTYNVASFLGKSFGAFLTPLAGILLGYFAQDSFKMSVKRFWIINSIIFLISALFFIFVILFGTFFTRIFFPTIVDHASAYLVLANLAAILGGTGAVTQASVLRYARTYWQIVIQTIYTIIYVGIGVISIKYWGVLGFCYAAIVANSTRLLLLYLIGQIAIQGIKTSRTN